MLVRLSCGTVLGPTCWLEASDLNQDLGFRVQDFFGTIFLPLIHQSHVCPVSLTTWRSCEYSPIGAEAWDKLKSSLLLASRARGFLGCCRLHVTFDLLIKAVSTCILGLVSGRKPLTNRPLLLERMTCPPADLAPS